MKNFQRFGSCLAAILLVSVFYLATIRSGQPWGDDFAMYIHEAKNIADGTPLIETGYIYNPARPDTGPRLYPPVFPILLVPGFMTGGPENLTPMKIEMTLFFIGLLVLLWLGLGHELPSLLCLALLVIVGFNPLFWDFKEDIVSDIPFAFLLYLTFTLADKVVADGENANGTRWQIPALGMMIYLCYGTKSIGVVLLPSLLILAAIYWKGSGKRVAWAVALSLVPCFVEQKLLGGYLSYAADFQHSPVAILKTVIQNIPIYLWSVANLWRNPYAKWVRDLLCFAVILLALVSYFRRLWSFPRIYEIFVPFYLGVVILWPIPSGFRYLIPILPLYLFYALEGVNTLTLLLRPPLKALVVVILAGLIVFSYAAEFGNAHFGPFQEGVGKRESVELFSFVRDHTAPNDVLIFRKPRALALFTGRSAAVYPEANTGSVFCAYFKSIGATYLIEDSALDDKSFDEFLHRQFSKKEPSFINADFRVLHLVPADLEQCAEGKVFTAPSAPSVPLRP